MVCAEYGILESMLTHSIMNKGNLMKRISLFILVVALLGVTTTAAQDSPGTGVSVVIDPHPELEGVEADLQDFITVLPYEWQGGEKSRYTITLSPSPRSQEECKYTWNTTLTYIRLNLDVTVVDLETGEEVGSNQFANTSRINCPFQVDPGSRTYYQAPPTDDYAAWINEVLNGREGLAANRMILVLDEHRAGVTRAYYSPDGRYILSIGGSVGDDQIWDAASGELLMELPSSVFDGNFSPDSRYAAASGEGTAYVWDLSTGERVLTLQGHDGRVRSVRYSPDGQRILTAGEDQTARVWDAVTGEQLLTLTGHEDVLWYATYSPDGQFIVTASDDQTARVWDASTGEQLQVLTDPDGTIYQADFSPDGQFVLTQKYSSYILRLWDWAAGEIVHTFTPPRLFRAQFSPDGCCVLAGYSDGKIIIWDIHTGEVLLELDGHSEAATAVAYSPSGRFIASGGNDLVIRVWDVKTGAEVLVLTGHTARGFGTQIRGLSFSPDARFLLSWGNDNTVRVWDLSGVVGSE